MSVLSRVEQWSARMAHNHEVESSNLSPGIVGRETRIPQAIRVTPDKNPYLVEGF